MPARTSVLLLISTIALSAQVPPFVPADPSASPRIAALRKNVEAGNTAEVAQFWADVAKMHTPLIEPIAGDDYSSLVTFVWQAKDDTRNVVLFGGVAGIDLAANQLTRLGVTDVWYKTYKVRNDARFTYQFSPNDSLEPLEKLDPKDTAGMMKRFSTMRPDPLNPRRFQQGPTPSSYVEMPGAPPQPWIVPVDNPPKGTVEQKRLRSAILNNERTVWVYTPPGFTAGGERYPLLVVFDGPVYVRTVPVPVILDNLIAKKRIPPMVAIVLANPTPTSRGTELPCHAPFADFLAKEVAPWMRDNYYATSDAARTLVGGSSYGGLAAVFAALRHPEVFGNVLSQSGSFWWAPDNDTEAEWLARQFVTSPKLPVRFFLEVGLMEAGPTPHGGPSQVVVNRHMRDILTAKGYAVHYREFNGGHEYLSWRGSFADGLLFLAQ
jgi:enterochelin esterase-like enzyme